MIEISPVMVEQLPDELQYEIHHFSVDSLPVQERDRLSLLYPEMERVVPIAILELPQNALIDFELHPSFVPIIKELAYGKDVGNTLQGGASGASIDVMKRQLAEKGLRFPTREEEYEYFRSQYMLSPDVVQVQVGGWPFNDGSVLYKRDVVFSTQDELIAQHYKESPVYNGDSVMWGFGTTDNGRLVPAAVPFSFAYPGSMKKALDASHFSTFVGSSPAFVTEGMFKWENIFGSRFGDPRHFMFLPYIGGLAAHGSYGIAPSGSLLMPEILDMVRSGKGLEILDAMKRREPIAVCLNGSTELLKYAFESNDEQVKNEFEKVGWSRDIVDACLRKGSIDFIPQPRLYNRTVLAYRNGRVSVIMTGGLLQGKVSGQSGMTIEQLGTFLVEQGYEFAVTGCEGRDVPQVMVNGQTLAEKWDASFVQFKNSVMAKESTTPSIFFSF